MSVTIIDIAKAAGVSHSTVSRALRDNPEIAAATTARIKQIAADLNYVPNSVARGLKTSRSLVIGVIIRRLDDPFFAEVVQGIENVLQSKGYSLFLAAAHRDEDKERAVFQAMSERRVDGVIISSSHVDETHRRQLDKFSVPYVLINNQAVEEEGAHSVYHDDVYGSQHITQHLIDQGHRHIAFLGSGRGGRGNEMRVQGCHAALAANGLEQRDEWTVIGPNGRPESGEWSCQRLFSQGKERPTAIVCYNDMIAIGAINYLNKQGLRVPEDVSVTGFDNIHLAGYFRPALTTFHQPKYELGQEAALMILRALGKADSGEGTAAGDVVILQGHLITRESTTSAVN